MATASSVTATVTAPSATTAASPKKLLKLPAPNSDFYQLIDVLTDEELATVKRVRAYMETKVQPIINKYWSGDEFPFELLPSVKELKLGGLGFEGYGCAAQDELQSAALADQTWQALGSAAARNESQGDFGLAELRPLDGDPNRAGHRGLAAATQGKAIDSRNHRFAEILDEIEHPLPETAGLFSFESG